MSNGAYCQVGRNWSCTTTQQETSSLICTCKQNSAPINRLLAVNLVPTAKSTSRPTAKSSSLPISQIVGIKAAKPSAQPSTSYPSFTLPKNNESISNACLNIMFQPQPLYTDMKKICGSSTSDNTCVLSVSKAYTCSKYCSSFPGMKCSNAFAPTKSGGCISGQTVTCDSMLTATSTILCQCGFVNGAKQSSSLVMSLFSSGLPYCPAYPTGTFTDDAIISSKSTRRLDNKQDKKKYGRSYKKITLTLDYNSDKADGSVKVTNADTKWDTDDWSTDTYNTGTPEMCTGLVSRIRKGDPPSKCSFGSRPGNNKFQNCYGKLYQMTFAEASTKCAARGGNLAKIDALKEFQAVTSLFVNDDELSIGLRDIGGNDYRWDGFLDTPVPSTWLGSTIPFISNSWYDDCTKITFDFDGVRNPYITTESCTEKKTYLCESKPVVVNNSTVGGDLLADEGGFCIWYYDNPKVSLPDDESGGFRNTELSYFNLYDPSLSTTKYVNVFGELFGADGIPGRTSNKANFLGLTGRMFGKNSNAPIIPAGNFNSSFHCHFSPTNFGVARIYNMQHMLERLYTGAAHDHCFCGYKNIGHLFDRCDCTRSGEQSNECLTEHRKLLYEETYAETGEYVHCNNCDNPSP